MRDNTDRLDFAPPDQPLALRALALAVAAHLLLAMALTWGINWKREAENIAAEAELWSSVPQQAAPKEVAPPPAPPALPAPPAPAVVAPPAPAPAKDPDIALEREARKKREQLERLEQEKKLEARKKLEAQKRERLAEQKAAAARKQQEARDKAARDKARQLAEEKEMAALREQNLKRMQGLAGASGGPGSAGTALRSSGPTDSYAGRIRARVKPNIVFTEDIAGNPSAEVEVRMAPDGTITSKKVVKSSGVKSWDEAVLRALDKTEVLPRDVDGRVHSPLLIEFRPKS